MARILTNLGGKRTVRGRTIRYTTFPCRIYECKWLSPVSPSSRASPLPHWNAVNCGSGLAREEAGTLYANPETTKATRRWPLFGEASAKREAYLTAQPVSSARALPMSASERTVLTPASCRAANFSSAVPLPPEMIAPAWPMRLPGGAVTPAM